MRKLILALFATSLLGGAVLAQPAEAACWRIPGGWRCVHHRVVTHRVIVHRTIVRPGPVIVHKTIVHRY